jgi:hypothetical protein
VLIYLEVAPLAVKQIVGTVVCDVLRQLSETFSSTRRAFKGAAYNHEVFALFHVSKSVLQLEDLVAKAALNPDLVYNIVEVSVLLLWLEGALALTTLRASRSQPLGDAASVKNLLAGAALD